jgi:hypothetical protein
MADPEVRAVYEKKAAKAKKHPRDLAISDYCKGKDLLKKSNGTSPKSVTSQKT